jgi:hypothetical protein
MKTKIFLTNLLAVLTILFFYGCGSFNTLESQDMENISGTTDEPVSLETLQDSLSGSGEWIQVSQDQIDPQNINNDETVNNDDNGTIAEDVNTNYIWVPNSSYVYEGWNPYNDGRWVWTSWGWEWVSDYRWGWVTYHYGRWWNSPLYGWVWSPGYRWSSSWVDWCYSDDIAYTDGYTDGYNNGFENGYYNGYNDGYNNGYNNGYIGWHFIGPREHHHNDGNVSHHHLAVDPWWVFVKKQDF